MEQVEIYKGRRGLALRTQWRFRWRATNGEILAQGESYNNYADCIAIAGRLAEALAVPLEVPGQVETFDI